MASTTSHRLDVELVERALAPSRERAQALIAAGLVEVDGELATSAARRVAPGAGLRLRGRDHPWASRGGVKLEAGLDAFGVDPADRVCLDAGASTGGFTDVLLRRGARAVYAVDVGRGLLDPRLAGDPRVTVLDRTNLRKLTVLPGPAPDLVTLDLSFISVRAVLPAVAEVTAKPADLVVLFKPQFELGRGAVGHGGVVSDVELGRRGALEFLQWMAATYGARSAAEPVPAPIRGAKGNQEWLVHAVLLAGAGPGRDR